MNRRAFLTTVAGAAVVGLAGCTVEYNGLLGGPNAGRVPDGGAPTLQDIARDQADVEVTTADALVDHAARGDGRIIWIPNGTEIDLTGRDLVIRGTAVASGRNENQSGAVITTSDDGASSSAWGGGSGTGLIRMEGNSRLTGVTVYGPHTNVTEHSVLSGYFPFAPGGGSARENWRRERFARGITVVGDNVRIDNIELAYFSVQGICIGPEGAVENITIAYCHLHNCLMTSYGYCVDCRHGDVTVYRSYLDAARHAIAGSGMADASYSVIESTLGPWATSHPLDMHRVSNNQSGSSDPSAVDYRYRAGGTILIRGCDIIPNRVPDLPFINHNRGGRTPHCSIRGVPADGVFFENNRCSHNSPTEAISQSGVPGRYDEGENGFVNIHYSGNEWGVDFEALQQVP